MADETAGTTWGRALLLALNHAIEHLQEVIFTEGVDALAAQVGAEAALREGVVHYEHGLARLFGFIRASGVLADAVAWSTLKAEQRRAALEAGVEITLRTALETGMYEAEAVPLGDHATYQVWASALTRFLTSRARRAAPFPHAGGEEERLYWAYEALADLEEHEAFHRAVVERLGADSAGGRDAVAAHQEGLLGLPRFDLVLNACLLWLAEHGGQEAAAGRAG